MPTSTNLGKISTPVNLIDYTTGNELIINSDGTYTIRLDDGSGNALTSQVNGSQRALDIGIDVAGVQIDPRSIRTLTSSDVVTSNIGTTGGLALDTTIAKLNISQGATLGTNTGPLIQGSVTTSNPTYITGQISPLSLTVSGDLRSISKIEDSSGNTLTSTSGALNVNISSISSGGTSHTADYSGDTYTAGTTKGNLTLGRVSDATSLSLTTGQFSPLNLDAAGSLFVHVVSSTSSGSNPTATQISDFVKANKTYNIATAINMTSMGVDNPLLLIKNPSNSGVVLYLYKLALGVIIANNAADYKLWYDPTITSNGTAITPHSNNVGNGAPASAFNCFTLPTLSSNGTEIEEFFYGQNGNSINFVEDFSIFIQPGHNLLLTGNPINSNNRNASVTIVWVEN